MDANGRFGMRVHQAVSFSRWMMRIPRADAVFFPGCALLTYDPALLNRMLDLLRREEPTIALAAGCCGQPTKHLEPQRFRPRTGKLLAQFQKRGVQRIYIACPNCERELSALGYARVIPVWETLERVVRPEELANHCGKAFALHDPCPVRQDRAQQDAVRSLLTKAQVTIVEFPHNRAQTRCCGNIAMLRATNPKKSDKMRTARLDEISDALPVTSYCAGCVDAFASGGHDAAHLVELLFGKSRARGWGNRLKNTLIPRKD